jgi:hypothetical protein
VLAICLIFAAAAASAQSPENCSISAGRWDGKLELAWKTHDCGQRGGCGESNSDLPWSRWSGIAPQDLEHEGAAIDARMTSDAGEIHCTGKVHDGELFGAFSFIENPGFTTALQSMGFARPNEDQLRGAAFLDVSIAWIKSMQEAHVSGMATENLMGLRALGVDAAYVRAMANAGYPELAADKLTGMKAVGVSPEKVAAVRAMGFNPDKDELIQMAVFKIDAPFVERMKARGFKNLTIAQLVQIKVFKLDE